MKEIFLVKAVGLVDQKPTNMGQVSLMTGMPYLHEHERKGNWEGCLHIYA